MVKKIFAFLILYIFVGCLTLKTDYGKIRFNIKKFNIKQNTNNNCYSHIDTNAIYKLIAIRYNGVKLKIIVTENIF